MRDLKLIKKKNIGHKNRSDQPFRVPLPELFVVSSANRPSGFAETWSYLLKFRNLSRILIFFVKSKKSYAFRHNMVTSKRCIERERLLITSVSKTSLF